MSEIETKFKRTAKGALVSTDFEGLKQYKVRKRQAATINKLVEDQHKMNEELSEIKSLLLRLVNKEHS